MPNYTQVLNEEIARIARREIKSEVEPLIRKNISLKKRVAELNKTVAQLESRIRRIEKLLKIEDVIPVYLTEEEVAKSRITSKYILNVREKYNLTRKEMAALLDVNANSIYLWESDRATPRFEAKAKIIQLRNMGKREVQEIIQNLTISNDE